jgi:nitroreductase
VNQHEQHVFNAIYGRRSVRSYVEGKDVEHEKIVKLLKAAMAAPSACNIQPWEFVVVTEPETVRQIKQSIERWGNYNAPMIIVVCSYPELIPWEDDNGVRDCSAAIENMLIAAPVMDLGAVWIGGFDPGSIRQLLDIPEHVVPVGVIYVGYPAEHHEPRTQYLEEAVYWQKYDPERSHQPRPGHII